MYSSRSTLVFVGLICSVIAGCSTTPVSRTQQPVINNEDPILSSAEIIHDADFYLTQAQISYQQNADKFSRNQFILRAAQAYKQQQQCQQVDKIVTLTMPELESRQLRNLALLLQTECISMQTPIDFLVLSNLLQQLSPELGYRDRINQLQLTLLAHEKNWLEAAKLRLTTRMQSDMNLDVWYLLQNLTLKQLEQASLQQPALQSWLQLSIITRRYGLDIPKLREQVMAWQQRFANHPLSVDLPIELQQALLLNPQPITRVAVLLPLSGRLVPQGMAIKQGVLAAYVNKQHQLDNNNPETTSSALRFFDTNRFKGKELAQLVTDYDVIIGPLMKDAVEQFLPYAPQSADIISLNQVEQLPVTPMQPADADQTIANEDPTTVLDAQPGRRLFFALSPEEEARQLADKVYSQGIRHPIVVSQQTGASRRMAEAFLQHWQELQERKDFNPALATFTDNKSMRTSVTTLLDVAQSNSRVDQVRYLTREEIHAVPRNRRDIDGIIVFANAQQTELLNPIIESSLSPFNDKAVPVFASSRSFSKNLSNNSLRDLRNLTFSDMPWMLPNHAWQPLKNEVESIWPEQDDTLTRLFALGYDAFNLTYVMPNLDTLPQLSLVGLTGELAVDAQGNITRKLAMGRIGENKVERIEMD